MYIRRPALAVLLALAVASLSPLSARLVAQSKDEKKRDKAQQQEIQTLLKVVDAVSSGQQPAPGDFQVTWQNHFLKAQEGKTYVPFTVKIDPAQVPSGPVAVYMRVLQRGGAPVTTTDDGKAKDQDKDKKGKTEFPFEDVHFVVLKAPGSGQPLELSRAFAVKGGDYDVYLAIKQRSPEKPEKNAPAPKMTVLKQPVTVPDFWTNELTTSSMIVADRVEPLTAPLTPEQQVERPYAFGTTQIVPASDLKFTKKEELSIVFMVYNPAIDGTNKKPDVLVEYNFHQKTGDAEKFFNKTSPQNFNAQTLPPQFDMALGHQLVAGQSVPLGSFPEGDYRLEIKITDKAAGKTVTRDVNFAVLTPS